MNGNTSNAKKERLQYQVVELARKHPKLALALGVALSVGAAILMTKTKKDEGIAAQGSDADAFVETLVRFVDGSTAYTTPNHTVEDLTRDNADIYR